MNSCGIFLTYERRRKALPFLVVSFILIGCISALGQGAKVTALSEPIKEEDSDHWRARDVWFMRGRQMPGQSSAALLYKAQQKKMWLRAKRAAAMRAQTGVVPFTSTCFSISSRTHRKSQLSVPRRSSTDRSRAKIASTTSWVPLMVKNSRRR